MIAEHQHETPQTIPKSVNHPKLAICIAIGLLIWLCPQPEGIDPRAWQLFALFVATIVGIITKPLPMGAVALLSMTISIITDTIPLKNALQGFTNASVWLVLMAFFIAKGFVVTHFGKRIAYFFTGLMGKKTLGLSYGLAITDLIMAPAIPSVTARSAGIVYPIAQSIANAYDSYPNHPSADRIGGFLTLCVFQVTVITSAMFITAMAANPLLVDLTQSNGIDITWGKWALAACVPGVVSLIIVPFVIYKLYAPEVKQTPNAPIIAKEQLSKMGKMRLSEWIMAGTILLLLVLWIFGQHFNIAAVTAAMVGLCILLITGVLNWKELLKEKNAWETFFWFCVLIMLAKHLNDYGLTDWFSKHCVSWLSGWEWHFAFPILCLVYFYGHYFFASSIAHVSAMYVAFLVASIGLGTPPLLAVFVLCFFSNLFGGISHYSLAPAPLLFGAGYVDIKQWWRVGFLISIVNIAIWSIIGGLWWKSLGLW